MKQPSPPLQLSAGIGLLSGSLMLFQICLTRAFSFSVWHHFAFMIISVALLGFAVSGVVLRLRPGLGAPGAPSAAVYALLFAATSTPTVWLVTRVPFDPTRLAQEPRQLAFLAVYYGGLLVPFTFAGLAIVTLLQAHAGRADRLYGSDLVGAGLGCVAAVFVIERLGVEGSLLVVSAGAAASAGVLALRGGRAVAGWALATAAVLAALFSPGWPSIPAGPGKGLHAVLDTRRFPNARLALTRWNAISRVDVVEESGAVSWTANLPAGVGPARQTLVVIDGDAGTPILHADDPARDAVLEGMLSSSVFEAFRPKSVLVIGAGGGIDVLAAQRFGAQSVDAVEVNPAVAELMTGRYAALSGHVFTRPGVTLHLGEGRSFVRHASAQYDAIQLSLVDTWAASVSGAYSLAEGYLYTVEAFRDYLDRLTPHGVLGLTRWLMRPPRETLKLCTVAAEALRSRGVARPGEHIAVLGRGNLSTVLVKRTAFTRAERDALLDLSRQRAFVVLYPPSADAPANVFAASLDTPHPEAFYGAYPYDVRPSTDDSPFFFNFGRWRDARIFGSGWKDSPIVLSGRLLLIAVLVQALALSLLLLVLPALRSQAGLRVARDARVLAFFFLIGLAFMLLEISLMQRFVLFLGHPVFAIALVLAVLLFAAGLGSLSAGRIAGTRPWPIFVAIVGLGVVHAMLVPRLLDPALGLSLASRLVVAAALVFPLGFVLGVPFPCAVARLGARGSADLVSWAWAANGSASVIGPILAVLLALDLGFTAVMLLAAAGYGLAYLAFPWAER